MTPNTSIIVSILAAIATLTPCAAQTAVAPDDPSIQYVGRWDRSDPAQPHSYWGGAYVRTTFTGTSVAISLAVGSSLVVSIDSEAFRVLSASAGDTALNAASLKEGSHTLLVGSAGQNDEVAFKGFVFDAGATTAPPAIKRPLIEFIGDSITTGTGSPAGTTNWAWNTAEALGCDHVQIAFSGLSLTSGFGCLPKKVGLDKLYLLEKNYNHLDETPQVPWNFSYTPDIVVVNLGQNDQCGAEPKPVFEASYAAFVRMLRDHFPKAEIFAIRPFGGAYAESVQAAAQVVATSGNSHVHFVDTQGWLDRPDYADGIHPDGVGNLKVMSRLVPSIRPFVPTNP